MKSCTIKRLLCLILSVLLLTGCNAGNPDMTNAPDSSGASVDTQAADTQPQSAEKTAAALEQIALLGESPNDHYRVWYEVFVYSFCDSNGDGIGDIPGLISKLDYLEELGVGGLWLMPIHPSTTYHKYNVSDYYDIDPAYGTVSDFETLLAECEQRNIRVIMDLVVNHTGSEHPWFKEATAYLATLESGEQPDPSVCPYVDYYFFKQGVGGNGWSQVTGTDWYYESQFSYDMPDLNLANEALRQEIADVMGFWLQKGVAGFRLDAAKEFYSGSTSKNQEVLSWLQETAVAIKPDVYLVAEVWDTFATITEYYQSGFMSIFNYPFGNSNGKIVAVLRAAGTPATVATYATALQKADKAYLGSNPNYVDAPFLSNHDVGRIAGFMNQDPAKTKLAGAMNLFMGGAAFLYYGEEIGMVGSGNDPSYRAPMYWNEARDQGTTNPPPDCIMPKEYPFGSLENQVNDDASVYNYYRQVIAIRNALPVISHGRVTAEVPLNIGCVSAQRKTWNEEECIILMNIDSQPATVNLTGYEAWEMVATLSADGNEIVCNGTTLELPAYGTAVLVKK